MKTEGTRQFWQCPNISRFFFWLAFLSNILLSVFWLNSGFTIKYTLCSEVVRLYLTVYPLSCLNTDTVHSSIKYQAYQYTLKFISLWNTVYSKNITVFSNIVYQKTLIYNTLEKICIVVYIDVQNTGYINILYILPQYEIQCTTKKNVTITRNIWFNKTKYTIQWIAICDTVNIDIENTICCTAIYNTIYRSVKYSV